MTADPRLSPARGAHAADPPKASVSSPGLIPNESPTRWRDLAALGCAWFVSALYAAHYLRQGWLPHDAGALAQSASRVLAGQWPHRDFIALYTGGLEFFEATAMRVGGTTLMTLRWAMFLLFLAWVPVLYACARRSMGPASAALFTIAVVAWSYPNYPEAMPSWPNLFFATAGTLALLRFLETRRLRWVAIAGICGGASCAVKISGLFFVAAALLFLVFDEQEENRAAARRGRTWAYSIAVSALLLLFIKVLAGALGELFVPSTAYMFFLPPSAIAIFLLAREVQIPGRSLDRFRRMLPRASAFVAGFAAPLLALVILYWRAHALDSFFNGIFVRTRSRLLFAFMLPDAHPRQFATAVLVCAALLYLVWTRRPRRWTPALLAVILGLVFYFSKYYRAPYRYAWYALADVVPILVLAALSVLALRKRLPTAGRDPAATGTAAASLPFSRLMLFTSVAALCSLEQFPFSWPLYCCYVIPLTLLAIAGLLAVRRAPQRATIGVLLVFLIAFGMLRLKPGSVPDSLGLHYDTNHLAFRFRLPRARGLRVYPRSGAVYEALVPLVRAHAGGSRYMYAATDCPEVYFLTGLRNPTPEIFDFLDTAEMNDPRRRERDILNAIRRHGINVIVLSHQVVQSGLLPYPIERNLRQMFPYAQTIGHFEVRWRTP